MNEYETEEQQIEALKKWWKENGTSLIFGLAIGMFGIFGWRYYVESNNANLVNASDMYMQLMQSVTMGAVDDKVIDLNNTLINEYSDTPYAALSSLAMAKAEYDKDNADGAVAQLELAVKHADDDIIKSLANLRLASLLIEQEKYSEAEAILNGSHDAAYDAQYEELKGDLFVATGKVDMARSAYDNAISLQGVTAGKWLKMKRQNLGQNTGGNSGAVSEDNS